MAIDATHARMSVQANLPAVEGGQVWCKDPDADRDYPNEIRIVCRYPFAKPADGRMWIWESPFSFERLERITELTLRQLYTLSEAATS
jgi:hypothetical protein